MEQVIWSDLDGVARQLLLARPAPRNSPSLVAKVHAIVEDVRTCGWESLRYHALRFDGREPEEIEIAPYAEQARQRLSVAEVDAIELAARNIAAFHAAASPKDVDVETYPGVRARKLWRPIDRVGLYIPGGAVPLFSSLLMLAIPAREAGVKEIIVTTPPRPDGSLEPVLALAAELCGIERIWTVGGAQAIAALAFGAGPIAPVMKICGPGNAYVNEAKRFAAQLPGGPAIDLPAGPSELIVLTDNGADPATVAADLLSQAEHDPAAQVMLVTTSAALAERVQLELEGQLKALPRADIAKRALDGGRIFLVRSAGEAIDVVNAYAPEHLSLAVQDPAPLLAGIRNAGAIFTGPHSAESFGDYLVGPSHVLPTDGAARAWSGVSVETFMKAITVHQVDEAAARALAGPAALLARLEGLEAHARAAELRNPSCPKVAA